jgi:hypothetical protein
LSSRIVEENESTGTDIDIYIGGERDSKGCKFLWSWNFFDHDFISNSD